MSLHAVALPVPFSVCGGEHTTEHSAQPDLARSPECQWSYRAKEEFRIGQEAARYEWLQATRKKNEGPGLMRRASSRALDLQS